MENITVDTDLHCKKCVETVAPSFNAHPGIKQWKVNLDREIKTLEVAGEGISRKEIESLLAESGYSVIQPERGFWRNIYAWKRASFNTLNCLIGCSIGDFGMVFYLQAFYPNTPIWLQMTLAVIAGLCTSIMLETVILKVRERFNWSFALRTAFGMSFLSMVAMEIAMTSTDFMITGGKAAFSDPMYWLALIPALVVGFITPLPYNYYKIKKINRACH